MDCNKQINRYYVFNLAFKYSLQRLRNKQDITLNFAPNDSPRYGRVVGSLSSCVRACNGYNSLIVKLSEGLGL